MRISSVWIGILAIIFGILVLAIPSLLRWLVGIFFIVAGAILLLRQR